MPNFSVVNRLRLRLRRDATVARVSAFFTTVDDVEWRYTKKTPADEF